MYCKNQSSCYQCKRHLCCAEYLLYKKDFRGEIDLSINGKHS